MNRHQPSAFIHQGTEILRPAANENRVIGFLFVRAIAVNDDRVGIAQVFVIGRPAIIKNAHIDELVLLLQLFTEEINDLFVFVFAWAVALLSGDQRDAWNVIGNLPNFDRAKGGGGLIRRQPER